MRKVFTEGHFVVRHSSTAILTGFWSSLWQSKLEGLTHFRYVNQKTLDTC